MKKRAIIESAFILLGIFCLIGIAQLINLESCQDEQEQDVQDITIYRGLDFHPSHWNSNIFIGGSRFVIDVYGIDREYEYKDYDLIVENLSIVEYMTIEKLFNGSHDAYLLRVKDPTGEYFDTWQYIDKSARSNDIIIYKKPDQVFLEVVNWTSFNVEDLSFNASQNVNVKRFVFFATGMCLYRQEIDEIEGNINYPYFIVKYNNTCQESDVYGMDDEERPLIAYKISNDTIMVKSWYPRLDNTWSWINLRFAITTNRTVNSISLMYQSIVLKTLERS